MGLHHDGTSAPICKRLQAWSLHEDSVRLLFIIDDIFSHFIPDRDPCSGLKLLLQSLPGRCNSVYRRGCSPTFQTCAILIKKTVSSARALKCSELPPLSGVLLALQGSSPKDKSISMLFLRFCVVHFINLPIPVVASHSSSSSAPSAPQSPTLSHLNGRILLSSTLTSPSSSMVPVRSHLLLLSTTFRGP